MLKQEDGPICGLFVSRNCETDGQQSQTVSRRPRPVCARILRRLSKHRRLHAQRYFIDESMLCVKQRFTDGLLSGKHSVNGIDQAEVQHFNSFSMAIHQLWISAPANAYVHD